MSIFPRYRYLERERQVVELEIVPVKFTNNKRSGNMHILEENKDSLKRRANQYNPYYAEKFPPHKI